MKKPKKKVVHAMNRRKPSKKPAKSKMDGMRGNRRY